MKSLKRRIAEYKIKRRKKPISTKKLMSTILGWLELVVGLCLAPFHYEEIYGGYYRRWKDPVFHWVLKRERKDKDVPNALLEMADKQVLLYRQMETEIESEI